MNIGIALGSNIGDRLQNLQRAREAILKFPLFELHADTLQCESAPIFETDPIGCEPNARLFYNTAIVIKSNDPIIFPTDFADSFLIHLQTIEINLGRPAHHFPSISRSIDIDWLYANGLIISNERLKLPHPRIAERLFALCPLAALEPDRILPNQTSSILSLLQTRQRVPFFSGHPEKICKVKDCW